MLSDNSNGDYNDGDVDEEYDNADLANHLAPRMLIRKGSLDRNSVKLIFKTDRRNCYNFD